MKDFLFAALVVAALGSISGVTAPPQQHPPLPTYHLPYNVRRQANQNPVTNNASQSGSISSCITDFPFGAYIYSGYSTNTVEKCQCETQVYNWFHTSNPPTRTLYRTIGVGSKTETVTTDGSTITTVVANPETFSATITENLPYGRDFNWYGSASPPCCSSCTIAAATVDVYFFPSSLPTNVPSSFVSKGYTFQSPSIYIGFSSLYAFDFCGTVGKVLTSTTIAFNPNEISTYGANIPSTDTFTDTEKFVSSTVTLTSTATGLGRGLKSQLNLNDLAQNCSSVVGYEYLAGNPSSIYNGIYDPCHPTIVLPARIKSIDPSWANCKEDLVGGFYDPPYALTKAGGLLPSSTLAPAPVQTPQPVSDPTATAAPAPITTDKPAADPTTSPGQPTATGGPAPADPTTKQPDTTAPPVDPSKQPPGTTPASQDPAVSQAPPASNPATHDPASQDPAASDPATSHNAGSQAPGDPATTAGNSVALDPGNGASVTQTLVPVTNPDGSVTTSVVGGENSQIPSVNSGSRTIPSLGGEGTTSQNLGSMIMSFILPQQSSGVQAHTTASDGAVVPVQSQAYTTASNGAIVPVSQIFTTASNGAVIPVPFQAYTTVSNGAVIPVPPQAYTTAPNGAIVLVSQAYTTASNGAVIPVSQAYTTASNGAVIPVPSQVYSTASNGAVIVVSSVSGILTIAGSPSSPSSTEAAPAQVTGNVGSRLKFEYAVPVAIGLLGGFAVLL